MIAFRLRIRPSEPLLTSEFSADSVAGFARAVYGMLVNGFDFIKGQDDNLRSQTLGGINTAIGNSLCKHQMTAISPVRVRNLLARAGSADILKAGVQTASYRMMFNGARILL
jgi:hypothetical protein